MTRRGPARVRAVNAKRPAEIVVEVAGNDNDADPRAVAELERLLADGRALVRDRAKA